MKVHSKKKEKFKSRVIANDSQHCIPRNKEEFTRTVTAKFCSNIL